MDNLRKYLNLWKLSLSESTKTLGALWEIFGMGQIETFLANNRLISRVHTNGHNDGTNEIFSKVLRMILLRSREAIGILVPYSKSEKCFARDR